MVYGTFLRYFNIFGQLILSFIVYLWYFIALRLKLAGHMMKRAGMTCSREPQVRLEPGSTAARTGPLYMVPAPPTELLVDWTGLTKSLILLWNRYYIYSLTQVTGCLSDVCHLLQNWLLDFCWVSRKHTNQNMNFVICRRFWVIGWIFTGQRRYRIELEDNLNTIMTREYRWLQDSY